MDEPRKHCYMKEASHKRPDIIWSYLYEMPRLGKFIEIESKLLFA